MPWSTHAFLIHPICDPNNIRRLALINLSDTVKLTSPRTFADKNWVGPVRFGVNYIFSIRFQFRYFQFQFQFHYSQKVSIPIPQCGLIIKLIDKVLWHLSQWISIKDLKILISKMRLKCICGDNFTPSPEIIHLFNNDIMIIAFLCHVSKLIFIVVIFNPSGLCLLKGNKVPSPCVFCDHTTGGNVPRNFKDTPDAWGVSHIKDYGLLC